MRSHNLSTRRIKPLLAILGSLLVSAVLVPLSMHSQGSVAGTEAEISAKGLPDPVSPEALQLVGKARLKVLLWSVYDSRLYTATGSYEDGQRPLRLEIQYLLDIKSEALVDRTLEEWTAMGRTHPRQQNWLTELSDIWPDIEENDVLSLELGEDDAAVFRRNGELLGAIADPDFGQQFIDIWLSSDCTRPNLRSTLLGN